MRFAISFAAAVALSGCTSIGVTSMDEQRDVRLITYESIQQVDAACRGAGYKALPFPLSIVQGCAVYTSKSCTVYARTPGNDHDEDAFRLLGHEAFHCFAGDWHHDQQKATVSIQRSRSTETRPGTEIAASVKTEPVVQQPFNGTDPF
ncbi:hypothetical protein [Thiohalomonas denitrificans]|uniref:Lipoprotein n=1 Tax=Thiohalomonas denitrificans TaxID=415747 RepID=A0A1G5Q8F2_9GAMM|nr:hypothetical protein [Thiohalomonas denitrificans]SCZ57932.1 hypothetical protein SAMN03097708_01550 [Thiohalomonas denitrificans]